ncbi:MAG: LysM peptidoglycan-binding domain-containing protein [Candidatus Omnitrophica bacterium]|nr:LysM peptidoglycan-binding domain-containing protein [Candidatus Omnitrophota bacterium]
MKGRVSVYLLGMALVALVLSGCVVRTYPLTKDRIDQDLTLGNRGYVKGGQMQAIPERKTTRTTQIVEVELYSPIRFERMSKSRAEEKAGITKTEDKTLEEGNRGYVTKSDIPEIAEPEAAPGSSFEKYTVRKNDTLQKISKKLYGTTKKWTKIYEANQDVLAGPNKIYVGQALNIPVEGLKETKENLK